MSVEENIAAGLKGMEKKKAKEKAMEILQMIGLTEKSDSYPSQLSGGQQQRIGIGRAMAVEPEVMLIDEPTSSLDPELVGEVLSLLYKLAQNHMTMIISTHEMSFCEKTLQIKSSFLLKGKLLKRESQSNFFTNRRQNVLNSF